MRRSLLLLFILPTLAAATMAQDNEGFVVIANRGRAEMALSREDVSRIFLRKDLSWPKGGEARPVDQGADEPVRERFTAAVHKRSVAAIVRYWQQQVFSGRGAPPQVLDSDEQVLEYVARTPDAIGYVSSGVRLAGVKVLRLLE